MSVTRKELEKNNRKEYVIEAAREIFFNKGYEKTTMDAIAKKAQLSKKTLYNLFKSKDELLLLVYHRGLEIKFEMCKEAISKCEDGLTKVEAWGAELYEFSSKFPGYLKLQLYWDYYGIDYSKISDKVKEDFRSINSEVIDEFFKAYNMGIDDGSISARVNVYDVISYMMLSTRAILNVALFYKSNDIYYDIFDGKKFYLQYLRLFINLIGERDKQKLFQRNQKINSNMFIDLSI